MSPTPLWDRPLLGDDEATEAQFSGGKSYSTLYKDQRAVKGMRPDFHTKWFTSH